jgi:hypothetical protein
MDTQEAKKWLRDNDNEMFLSGMVGASGNLLCEFLVKFAAAHSAQVEAELRAKSQECDDAYRAIKSMELLLGLAYVDADGETKNPITWKSVAEEQAFEIGRYQGRIAAAEAELVKLRDWKDSAMQVLAEWDKVAAFAAENGTVRLGHSKAAETLRVMSEVLRWIPVEERLPKSEGRYLIVYQEFGTRRAFIGDYLPYESRWTCSTNTMRVTHWREIGALPVEALGETGPETDNG